MVHVETVDLASRGVTFPSDHVGMVIAQPYLPRALLTSAEPYQCKIQNKSQQLAMLNETLAVARAASHGAIKTHFTVFPEYSIPGLEGVASVEAALSAAEWPNGTVVIGGTDGLSQTDYVQLLQGAATHVDTVRNGSSNVRVNQWINCAIIWVKGSDGRLERWIQPKLHPSWEEMDIQFQHMFQGSSIFIFKGLLENGSPYRFGALVCFDWIATVGSQKTCQWILSDLQQQAIQSQLPLSWLFIIQRNKKPSHDTFLAEVGGFFNQTEFPNAFRDRACLIFVNTAGLATPGRVNEFGGSSVVLSHRSGFSSSTCEPTFSNGGQRFRDGCNLLFHYKDVFFRERGACIHSFIQINPGSLTVEPAGRSSLAVKNAYVFSISGVREPRAPGLDVPACVKWLNDELDQLPSLSTQYSTAPLITQVDLAHRRNIAELRMLTPQAITNAVRLATELKQSKHADEWEGVELEALKHVVYTLDIIGVGFASATFGLDGAHATVLMNGQTVDLLAVQGSSHEDCIKHSKNFYSIMPQRQALLVSRDRDNNPWRRRFGSFLEQDSPLLGQERRITDPASGVLHLGYRRLLDIFQQSTTVDEVQGAINAELAA